MLTLAHSGAVRPILPQDKEKVLADVRTIISQQLGTDLEKVRARWRLECCSLILNREDASASGPPQRRHASAGVLDASMQVAADSKFVDLGADSLDTVSWRALSLGGEGATGRAPTASSRLLVRRSRS